MLKPTFATKMEELFEKDQETCAHVGTLMDYYEIRELLRVFTEDDKIFALKNRWTGRNVDLSKVKIITLTGSGAEGCMLSRLFGSGEIFEYEIDFMVPYYSLSMSELRPCDSDHPGYYKVMPCRDVPDVLKRSKVFVSPRLRRMISDAAGRRSVWEAM